jgi:hypothetical protein
MGVWREEWKWAIKDTVESVQDPVKMRLCGSTGELGRVTQE